MLHQVFERAKAVLFDLDGTLICGEEAISGAVETVNQLAAAGKRIVYLTNNATRTRTATARLLTEIGFAAAPEMVMTSSVAAVDLLLQISGAGNNVYVIGEDGLRQPLVDAGFVLVDGATAVDAVVVGLDRSITYERFTLAVRHVLAGATFIATNRDRVIPLPDGYAPGAGALVALIETATRVSPLLAGKPSPAIVAAALRLAQVDHTEAILVGDNPETDILAAKRAGVFSVFVETGVPITEEITPDAKISSLAELLR